jgi:hypothetical protein
MLKRMVLITLLVLGLFGCATTETPMSLTAKGLLSGRLTVIGLAQTSDALCTQGIMKQAQCDLAKDSYQKAQAAYKVGSDAMLAWIVTGTDGGNTAQSSLAAVNSLAGNMQTVVNTFTGGK